MSEARSTLGSGSLGALPDRRIKRCDLGKWGSTGPGTSATLVRRSGSGAFARPIWASFGEPVGSQIIDQRL
jgi:hypothetical protein